MFNRFQNTWGAGSTTPIDTANTWQTADISVHNVCIYVYVLRMQVVLVRACTCVYVLCECVCVRETERDTHKRERNNVCTRTCVCLSVHVTWCLLCAQDEELEPYRPLVDKLITLEVYHGVVEVCVCVCVWETTQKTFCFHKNTLFYLSLSLFFIFAP